MNKNKVKSIEVENLESNLAGSIDFALYRALHNMLDVNDRERISREIAKTYTERMEKLTEQRDKGIREEVENDIRKMCQQLPMIAHSEELIKRYRALHTPPITPTSMTPLPPEDEKLKKGAAQFAKHFTPTIAELAGNTPQEVDVEELKSECWRQHVSDMEKYAFKDPQSYKEITGELAQCDFCRETKPVRRYYVSVANKHFSDDEKGCYHKFITYCNDCGISDDNLTLTRQQAFDEAVEIVKGMKKPLWNDDIRKHTDNVIRHNTLDNIIQTLQAKRDNQ